MSNGNSRERNEFDLPEDDLALPDPSGRALEDLSPATPSPDISSEFATPSEGPPLGGDELPLPAETPEAAAADEAAVTDEAAAPAEEPKKKRKKEKKEKPPREPRKPREPGEGFVGKLQEASPFTVMLGIAVGAILLGILLLFLVLVRYGLDIGASSAPRVGWSAPAHSGAETTAATA